MNANVGVGKHEHTRYQVNYKQDSRCSGAAFSTTHLEGCGSGVAERGRLLEGRDDVGRFVNPAAAAGRPRVGVELASCHSVTTGGVVLAARDTGEGTPLSVGVTASAWCGGLRL